MGYLLWFVARTQVRAQTFDAHHCIDVIMEMFFDYLIAIVALEAMKIREFES